MRIDPFRGCCGAYIIHDFGNTNVTEGTSYKTSVRDTEAGLKRLVTGYGRVSFLTLVLNPEQKNKLEKCVIRCGFKPVAEGFNYNHSSDLTMYVRCNKR